jgi:hypothetical protein
MAPDLAKHQADEGKNNHENRDIEKLAMPDPALNLVPVKKVAERQEDEERDRELAHERREKDAADIDFLEHDYR